MATVQVKIDTLECDDTTEAGADEVYILAFGKRSDGATYTVRHPGDGAHWDMNDGNQPTDNPNGDSHRITNKTIFVGDLTPGQSWDVLFMVMEEDGGTTKTVQEIGAGFLVESGNPYAIAGGVALGILTSLGLFIRDTDDYIGSFAVHIVNENGAIRVVWRTVDRVFAQYTFKNGFEFDMNGDGSLYKAWVYYE
jgi:hypothetical protein